MCQYLEDLHDIFKWSMHNITKSHMGKKSIQSEDILMGFSCMETQKIHWYGFRLHIGTNL